MTAWPAILSHLEERPRLLDGTSLSPVARGLHATGAATFVEAVRALDDTLVSGGVKVLQAIVDHVTHIIP